MQEERPAKVLEPRNIFKKTKFPPSDGLDQYQIALLLDEKEEVVARIPSTVHLIRQCSGT